MTSIFRSPTASWARLPLPVPRAVAGFAVLLAVLFAVSYAAGSAAGPVAPGIRQPAGVPSPGSTSDSGNTGGMSGMGK